MELLVVLAITAILMVIMFVPLSRAIDMVRRSEAQVKGQDSVRTAARRISRELATAMEVFEPRPLQMWGFNAWTFAGNDGTPANGAVPEAYVVQNGVLAMRMPKLRYFDTVNQHYVTPVDMQVLTGPGVDYDAVALGTCPNHPGAALEMRPRQPLEPDNRIVAYFVALKDPTYRPLAGNPTYNNLLLFGKAFGPNQNLLNTYVLYRVEFKPQGVVDSASSTNTDGDSNGLDDRWQTFDTDPGFFYDQTSVTVTIGGASRTQTRAEWWKEITVSQMDSETADMARWIEQAGKWVPKPLCTFNASPTAEVVLAPNRSSGSYLLGGGPLPGNLPPLDYTAENAHWAGVSNDGSILIPNAMTVGPANATQLGPQIQVISESQPLGAVPPLSNQVVYDSMGAARTRLISYDNVKGRVVTAFRRWDYANSGNVLGEHYSAPVNAADATAQLVGDVQSDPNGMPSSFGACKAIPVLAPNTRIVPGSEVVTLITHQASPPELGEQMRRAGWSGLGGGLDQDYVSQNELAADEYTINYFTGEITLANQDLSRWSNMGTGSGQTELLVRYRFQTNRPDDVVKVSYTTKELLAMNLGIIEYTRRRREALPYEISERVVVRNLKR